VEPGVLADVMPVPLTVIMEAARQAEVRHLAVRRGVDMLLTDQGREVADRLAEAREASLAELLGDWWGPDRPTDLVRLVRELNGELCGSRRERPYGTRSTQEERV
jgi:hypothetical protein